MGFLTKKNIFSGLLVAVFAFGVAPTYAAAGSDSKAKPKAKAKAKAKSKAKPKAEAKASDKKTETKKVSKKQRPALREVKVSLAKNSKGRIAPKAGTRSKKDEERVPHRIIDPKKRAAVLGKMRGPNNRALATIEEAVLAKRKRANGKVILSMRVAKSGKVSDVFVVGFDEKLDASLEKEIAATKYPELKGRSVKHTLLFKKGVVTRR